MAAAWCVYMVRCGDGSLYTGIATDAARRAAEHNGSDLLAAKYTRVRRPVVLVYREQCGDRAAAARREHAIKRMSRSEKLSLIEDAAVYCAATQKVKRS
jgi:putative endonuclease